MNTIIYIYISTIYFQKYVIQRGKCLLKLLKEYLMEILHGNWLNYVQLRKVFIHYGIKNNGHFSYLIQAIENFIINQMLLISTIGSLIFELNIGATNLKNEYV